MSLNTVNRWLASPECAWVFCLCLSSPSCRLPHTHVSSPCTPSALAPCIYQVLSIVFFCVFICFVYVFCVVCTRAGVWHRGRVAGQSLVLRVHPDGAVLPAAERAPCHPCVAGGMRSFKHSHSWATLEDTDAHIQTWIQSILYKV